MASLRKTLGQLTVLLLATSAACSGPKKQRPTGGGCEGMRMPNQKDVPIDPPLRAELDKCTTKPDCPEVCKIVLTDYGGGAQDCTVKENVEKPGQLEVSFTTQASCPGRRPATAAREVRAIESAGELLARQAELEALSVGAFEDLARALAAHGAPEELVRIARQSAREEIEHARTCEALARRFGGVVEATAHEPAEVKSLEALAIENAIEGEVRELWGAAVATWQAQAAGEPAVRDAMLDIARDETRHAELALRIGAWVRSKLSAEAGERVDAAKRAAIAELVASVGAEPPAAAVHELGVPDATDARRLLDGLRARVWN